MTDSTFKNQQLQLANDFVRQTGSNIFLTGKAGTGKTTFLHNLCKNTPKNFIVTAPTGVAAINAGGVTLHSFFQLPFGIYIPGTEAYERHNQKQFRFSKKKIKIIKSLDLLIIDEISMVRADLLDAVDATLRRHRRSEQPFGGVQLLMIGDLHQLSPVVKREEWHLLQQYYDSVYFFSSKALAQTEFIPIELNHIYRQSDAKFIEVLNKVRDNALDEDAVSLLNKRCIPDFSAKEFAGYITLTTHNQRAESINYDRLHGLKSPETCFAAKVSGEFPEQIYPTAKTLILKEGAQVMFIRNDSSTAQEKRYYNGKIGTIAKINHENIKVLCAGDSEEIIVETEEWENIQYKINEESKKIEEEVIGTFEQFPLKLAWAITIHKSQGLTFEHAIIDAQAAFAYGQVYVALSRCKSLEGMVLSSPLSSREVKTDKKVLLFDEECRKNPPTREMLEMAQVDYQQKLLFGCFDLGRLRGVLGRFLLIIRGNPRNLTLGGIATPDEIEKKSAEIFKVAENFCRQLNKLFIGKNLPEVDSQILERIGKASLWFNDKFTEVFGEIEQGFIFETDNSELRKKINRSLDNLRREIVIKRAGISSCANGFSPSDYLRALARAELDFKVAKTKQPVMSVYTESDIAHPEMFETLLKWREERAKEREVGDYQIMHQRILIQIVVFLPDSIVALQDIPGVGRKTIEKYGDDILKMVREYRLKKGIVAVDLPKTRKKMEDTGLDTKEISLQMFRKGMAVEEIAKERGLVNTTIEGHLAFFVEKGELEVGELLSVTQREEIEQAFNDNETDLLSDVKRSLNDVYSYGQLKMVLAYKKFQDSLVGG